MIKREGFMSEKLKVIQAYEAFWDNLQESREDHFILRLTFSDRVTKDVDFRPLVEKSAPPLLDPHVFMWYKITPCGNLEWRYGEECEKILTFYPTYLYEHGKTVSARPYLELRIKDTEYVRDFILRITFSDGVTKDVDFYPLLNSPVLLPLRDVNHFLQFGLMPWGNLEWYNGADFDPQYLYENGKIICQVDREI